MIGYKIIRHRLIFNFEAGTSRGVLTQKDTWYIKLWESGSPEIFGIGECSPLPGLSLDFSPDFPSHLEKVCREVFRNLKSLPSQVEIEKIANKYSHNFPSIAFGIETALLDLMHGGKRNIFPNDFYEKGKPISINGLVWMGDKSFMLKQINDKIDKGFDCIKIKVGAIKFEEEVEVIRHIRKHFDKNEISIRLDANGAFTEANVFKVLDVYARLDIHSIEQPVKAGQVVLMEKVCSTSPIPIALDEELIGISNKKELLENIKPQYIILKPSLLGGIQASREWIHEAEKLNIGWWMTSLLESNIGLNAIAQLTSNLQTTMPQGLGTGQLFKNNIGSPLEVRNGTLNYSSEIDWDLTLFK